MPNFFINDIAFESSEVKVQGTWGDAFLWHIHSDKIGIKNDKTKVLVVESRPAAQYLARNRFLDPEVIKHYFKEIMSIVFQAYPELSHKIACPIYDGARPLADGIPSDVQKMPLRCKRDNSTGDWIAKGNILEGIKVNYQFDSEKIGKAEIKICIIDECAASGSSLKKAVRIVIEHFIGIATGLLKNFEKIVISVSIVGIWFSSVAIKRVWDEFENLRKTLPRDEKISIEPIKEIVVNMGISALTEKSDIYGNETGLPLDDDKTIISKKFYSSAHLLCQSSAICGVGDVGLSIGNPKVNVPDYNEFDWHYGHRYEGFREVDFFEIDHRRKPWCDELLRIWNIDGNSMIPSFQTYFSQKNPELFEQYAKIYGVNLKKTMIANPIQVQ